MHVGQFPAAAANSLIEGYCDDFVSLASILAQTLEQVSMRQINIDGSRGRLTMIETGMRELADAIHDLLGRSDLGQGSAEDSSAAGAGAGAITATGASGAGSGQHAAAARAGLGEGDSSEFGGTATAAPPTARPSAPGSPGSPGSSGSSGSSTPSTAPSTPPAKAPFAASNASASAQTNRGASKPRGGGSRRARPSDEAEEQTSGMKGNNASMPILTVFQFVERMRKSGEMRVDVGDETLRFSFDRGFVQGCVSNGAPRGERLSDLLVETRAVEAEALNTLVRRLGRCTANQLAEAVVRERLATNGQVIEALELQVQKRFRRACRSRDASYEFVEGRTASAEGRVRIAPMELSHEPRRSGH